MILKATWDFWDGSSCRRSLKGYSCWMFVWIFHACGFLYTFSWDFYWTGSVSMLYLLMKNARSFLEIYHFAVNLTSFFPLHQKDDLIITSSPFPPFQWQLTILKSLPFVGYSFVLNQAEGLTLMRRSCSKPSLCTTNYFELFPTVMNNALVFMFAPTPLITTSIFSKRKKKASKASTSK